MKGNLMGELNIGSERIITVIQCKVKKVIQQNSKSGLKIEHQNIFMNLKKKIQSAMNGFYLMMGIKQH